MTPVWTIDYQEPERSWHHQRHGGGDRKGDDGKHGHKDWWERLLSLEGTRTLTDQRFDVALVRPEDRERAMQCEALDKLEEFTLK